MRSGVNGPASSLTRSGTAGPWTSTCATFRRMRWHGWRPLPSHRARGADAVPDVRRHGSPGLRVSELFLGAITFGEQGGASAPIDECRRILDAYAASTAG